MSDWIPLTNETRPREQHWRQGNGILCYFPDVAEVRVVSKMDFYRILNSWAREFWPTHWQTLSLPEPPE